MLDTLRARNAHYLSVKEWKTLAESAKWKCHNLATLLKCSARHLERVFHRRFNCTPQEWLDRERIVEAQRLLLRGEQVKNVASQLDFKQASHFSKEFKIRTGMRPSEFVGLSLTENRCRSEIINVARRYGV